MCHCFRCHVCQHTCRGFINSVTHMTTHDETPFVPNKSPVTCVLCGKAFGRRDHLKNHLFYHILKIRPGTERIMSPAVAAAAAAAAPATSQDISSESGSLQISAPLKIGTDLSLILCKILFRESSYPMSALHRPAV